MRPASNIQLGASASRVNDLLDVLSKQLQWNIWSRMQFIMRSFISDANRPLMSSNVWIFSTVLVNYNQSKQVINHIFVEIYHVLLKKVASS